MILNFLSCIFNVHYSKSKWHVLWMLTSTYEFSNSRETLNWLVFSVILKLDLCDKNNLQINLKLVRTPLNVLLRGFSKLSFSLYAPIYLGWTSCLISFAWDQSTCQERVESDKIQNEKLLPTVGLEPTTLSLEV